MLTSKNIFTILFLYIETKNKMENLKTISKILNTLKTSSEIYNFMLEILTEAELTTLSKRWQILRMLSNGSTQREIAKELQVSLCKVTRGSKILKNPNSIVNKILIKEKNNGKND